MPGAHRLTKEEVDDAYEMETGNVIIEEFTHLDPVAVPGTLVRNHGPFLCGKKAAAAV